MKKKKKERPVEAVILDNNPLERGLLKELNIVKKEKVKKE